MRMQETLPAAARSGGRYFDIDINIDINIGMNKGGVVAAPSQPAP